MDTPAPSFEADVKPLFRQRDRGSMTFLFDLWDHADVTAHANAILSSLESGEMPCDDTWPPERVAILRAWISGGCQP